MKKHVVVIGAGLAGSLLCNELAGFSKVTLLEKGPENTIRHPEFVFDHKPLAGVSTCCYGGGTTNLWHNGLIPLRPEDVVEGEFRGVLADADRFADATAAALFYPGASFTDEHRRLREETRTLSPSFQAFSAGVDCLVYPKHFKRLKAGPAVEAVYDVESVQFDYTDGRVSGVVYSIGGESRRVEADQVIVCAGTLGTPLLVEDILQAAGIDDPFLGQGFIDHPMGFVGKVRVKPDVAPAMKKLAAWNRGGYVSRSAVRLKSSCGRYTACAFLRPALTMANRLDIYKYKSALGASSGMARVKAAFSWKLFHPDIIAEIVAHLTGRPLPSRTYNILLIADQKRAGNRVYQTNGKIHVDWTVTDEELAVYRAMLKDLEGMLGDLAEEININTELTSDWLWSAAHHSGTISLGSWPEALVDTNLKLKCCDNVYVCDGSVLQEHSYANTGLAIGQLAFRLADHLKRLGGEDGDVEG